MAESEYVRVPTEEGERTRKKLLEAEALDHELEIKGEGDYLKIPVDVGDDDDGLPDGLEVDGTDEFERRETHTTPEEILGYSPSFETVGDVALLEPDTEEPEEAGNALVEADNNVETALLIESKVKGEERTREMRHVAGEERTEAVHREYGSEFELDLADVYFSPRLANERQRVVSQVEEGERVLDMFAGVGPFAIQIAEEGADVTAVDINPDAVEYLLRNSERNGVAGKVRGVNADVRIFVEHETEMGNEGYDRIVMNLPHSADGFLDTAFEAARDGCTVHYYDIRHEDDLFDGAVEVIEEAASEHGFGVEVLERVEVRSYAPHEYNVCIDFRVVEE